MFRQLSLSQACQGFVLYKTAAGLSQRSIDSYKHSFDKLALYFPHDPPLSDISRHDLVAFFAWLQNEYVSEPDGVAPRGRIRLSPKTIYNIHTNLSALWKWAVVEGLVKQNLVRGIDAPRVEPPVIEPFTQEQIQALLKACDHSRTWKTRELTRTRRPTADRDRAIIMVLLDTGVRASELCGIRLTDLDLGQNTIKVAGKGRGRGKKERFVYFGRRTSRALWRYITPRLDPDRPDALLFTVGPADDPRPLTRDVLRQLVQRIGRRAGVANVHPHRFRHTFAITYLRNRGDIFTLQRQLGHSSLDMVRRYLNIVQADCAEAHQRASPVDNWQLK